MAINSVNTMTDTGDYTPGSGRMTGRKLFFIILGFFGVITVVNMIMMTFAISTFGGLVVPNTYVASQRFNQDVAAAAEGPIGGWSFGVETDARGVIVTMLDAEGRPARGVDAASATVGRRTHGREDRAVALTRVAPGVYRADGVLSPGAWRLELVVEIGGARDGRRVDFYVFPPRAQTGSEDGE